MYFSGFDFRSKNAFCTSSTGIISEISEPGFRFPLASWSIASAKSLWLTLSASIFGNFFITKYQIKKEVGVLIE